MPSFQYEKGIHDLGNGTYAYLQPNGSWGWSNAGLITSGGSAILIDTLFDLRLTEEMLTAMRRATRSADRIGTVVNTHANGDHCWGNQLLPEAEIVASRRGAEEMEELAPALVAKLARVARIVRRLGKPGRWLTSALGTLGVPRIASVGEAADFLIEIFGAFEFDGITLRPPTRTFDGELELRVGDKEVRLIEVGPAHTRGDLLVHLPSDRVVFTGDILFVGGHPVMWEGPIANWIAACDRILAMDVEVVVPGHGPITDKRGVSELRAYLEHVAREARRGFEAGLSAEETALGMTLDEFDHWHEDERLIVNVATLFREFRGDASRPDPVQSLAQMARYRAARRAGGAT